MSTTNTFLAVYLGGGKDGARMAAWNAMPEAERKAKEQQGMAAWGAWVQKHHDVIVEMGGPLGKTTKVDGKGVADVTNLMTGFTVVRAPSQEAAAKLFENHPHFAIFPGEAIEIMPVLPIPGR
ncbi:YciI family protein [Bradyrhizobium genosp. P]|uniref:YciI family protein n=1 Tax=Bradyrhizobium genosp. P TaxID=83641 RepID=UPI003CF69A90